MVANHHKSYFFFFYVLHSPSHYRWYSLFSFSIQENPLDILSLFLFSFLFFPFLSRPVNFSFFFFTPATQPHFDLFFSSFYNILKLLPPFFFFTFALFTVFFRLPLWLMKGQYTHSLSVRTNAQTSGCCGCRWAYTKSVLSSRQIRIIVSNQFSIQSSCENLLFKRGESRAPPGKTKKKAGEICEIKRREMFLKSATCGRIYCGPLLCFKKYIRRAPPIRTLLCFTWYALTLFVMLPCYPGNLL